MPPTNPPGLTISTRSEKIWTCALAGFLFQEFPILDAEGFPELPRHAKTNRAPIILGVVLSAAIVAL